MKSAQQPDLPYKNLGIRLKKARQHASETLSEVSCAVEVDEKVLSRIESGHARPSEDLLEMLSSHFKLKNEEAIKLLELAGYTDDLPESSMENMPEVGILSRTIIMMLSQDKTLYTDGLDIHYDSNGLLLNFKQNVGQAKPVSVAKLGMSYDQAKQVHKTLTRVLLHAKYLKDPMLPSRSVKKSPKS